MRFSLLLLLGVGVAACTPDYPMDKEGTWSIGAYGSSNDANLRAMVVNPHDLIEGQGEPNSLSAEAAPPVKRLLTGKRRPLPVQSSTNAIAAPQEQQPAQESNP